jgi:hypothetical protein
MTILYWLNKPGCLRPRVLHVGAVAIARRGRSVSGPVLPASPAGVRGSMNESSSRLSSEELMPGPCAARGEGVRHDA